jgi:hypothetical protein
MQWSTSLKLNARLPLTALVTLGLLSGCTRPGAGLPPTPPRVVATGLNGPQRRHPLGHG